MSDRHSRGTPSAARVWAVLGFVLLAAIASTSPTVHGSGSLPSPGQSNRGFFSLASWSASSISISDGQTVGLSSPVRSVLTDTVGFGSGAAGHRWYWVNLTASVAVSNVSVSLTSLPITKWALPQQLPGGADSLPPLAFWNWTVLRGGTNDTSQWTATSWDQQLSRATNWTNQSYEIIGTSEPRITVLVDPTQTDGTTTPGTGFVVNTPGTNGGILTNDTGFPGLVTSLHPSMIRFSSTITDVSLSWNAVTNEPKYNFTLFDEWVDISHAVHSQIFANFPAGTWGDGNLLPTGMPLNHSILVSAPGGSGYFPADQAWEEWIEGVVNHTVATGANISYWSIGNEVPTYSHSEVAAYTHVFNLAEAVIHAQLPNAKVGSDVMTNVSYESYFATHAQGVGFLSFHYYPSDGICVQNGSYCPPEVSPNGTTDESLFSHPAYTYLGGSYSPNPARWLWHNLTGNWLPMLNTESNLNGVGGNSATASIGTDPRIQNVVRSELARVDAD